MSNSSDIPINTDTNEPYFEITKHGWSVCSWSAADTALIKIEEANKQKFDVYFASGTGEPIKDVQISELYCNQSNNAQEKADASKYYIEFPAHTESD